jgi:glycosyltransferase involved in cell wall biosynthesis
LAVPIVLVAGRDPLSELSGGHSSYVRAHARAVLRAGFVPHLFCVAPRAGTVETDFGVIHRVRSVVRPFRQLAIAGHGPALVRAIERFARAGHASGPLLIHGFGVWGAAGVVAARRLPANLSAIAVVSSYTTYEEESRSKVRGLGGYSAVRQAAFRAEHLWIRLAVERYERRAYLGARRVLLNYDSVRRLIAAKYGLGPRCQKIPYGAESSFRAAGPRAALPVPLAELLATAPESPTPPVLVAISRHDPRKGVDVLLHALARLRGEGIAFRACLVGGGPLLGDHRRLAARLGLSAVVALPGAVPDAYAYLQHAELFVLPSREEQSGSLALLEALQAGLPIVASGVDGIPEDVTAGVDALLVAPGDPEALAAALARALAAPGLRRALGARARETYDRRFSPGVFAAGLAGAYAELGVVA